jgi:3-oxoacyl-[acyl-carrier-protein] synthase-1
LILGTSTGGILETERAYGHHQAEHRLPSDYDYRRQHTFHAFAEALAALTRIAGPCYVVSTACSSSSKVFASARRLLDAGVVDAALVGGVDSLCYTTVRGFYSLGVMASEACRPFGENRPGMNVGEGGALLLLERDGEGTAQLLGVGESSDAYHMSSPDPEGRGATHSMRSALAQGAVDPSELSYVNAHGTGTAYNDTAEAKAIGELVGDRVPVASTKGYTGHTLGACGATEAVFGMFAIEEQWVPASLGARPTEPGVELWLPDGRLEHRCRYVLSNSFAFGGSNASVLLGELR